MTVAPASFDSERQRFSIWFWTLAGLVAAVAVWVRLAPLFTAFIIGDGGLFWVMSNELRANAFVPPMTTGYNDAGIPWVYPPLGLYLVAALGGSLDLFRVLPAVFAIATVPAFWLLARALITPRAALVATAAYALSAPAYIGLLAGGGVTRGPGLVLALLTLWAVARGRPIPAGILGGLVLLTHPIAAFYALVASGTLWLTRGAPVRMLVAPGIAAVVGGLWFIPMIVRHGPEPLLTGLGSRELDVAGNLITLFADAINPPNLAFTIGAVGFVIAIRSRRWDLVALAAVSVFAVAVIDRWAVIPMALLAGVAIDAALHAPRRRASVSLLAVAGVCAVTGIGLARPPDTLSSEQVAIFEWAERETPQDAIFAVIGYSPDHGMVEWFPAISNRVNLTSWQGTEWLPDGYRRAEAIKLAACDQVACLSSAHYFVLRPECCDELVERLAPVTFRTFERRE